MSSHCNERSGESFGVEGEQGEIVVSAEGENIQAVVKRECVCETDDSYTRTLLCINSGDLKVEVPLKDQTAIDLGELLAEAGERD